MRNVLGVVGLGLLTLSFSALEKVEAQVWEVGGQRLDPAPALADLYFGHSLALGDFDGNGHVDLAVGIPGYDSLENPESGRIVYYLGTVAGTLVSSFSIDWGDGDDQLLGYSLAAGDFDGDGRDELAAGRPFDDVVVGSPRSSAGTVLVLRWGLDNYPDLDMTLSQAQTTAFSIPEVDDHFGKSLAVGDFNGDGYEDLAVGVPDEDWSAEIDVGVVHVYYGSASGLRTDNIRHLLSASRTPGEYFGHALAAGDFRRTGKDALAVGAPLRDMPGIEHAGAVEVYWGSATGVLLADPQVITDLSLSKTPQERDYFGYALAAGDFNRQASPPCAVEGDCNEDLAIGVPGQLINNMPSAGKVEILYGQASGLATADPVTLAQILVGETVEEFDQFGESLAASERDPEGGEPSNLAVGVQHEDTGPGLLDDGLVHLVFGSPLGINAGQAAQLVEQRPGFGIAPPMMGDLWGYALALGDFDGDGCDDLAASALFKENGLVHESGAVQVLYGALFADGFERGDKTGW